VKLHDRATDELRIVDSIARDDDGRICSRVAKVYRCTVFLSLIPPRRRTAAFLEQMV